MAEKLAFFMEGATLSIGSTIRVFKNKVFAISGNPSLSKLQVVMIQTNFGRSSLLKKCQK